MESTNPIGSGEPKVNRNAGKSAKERSERKREDRTVKKSLKEELYDIAKRTFPGLKPVTAPVAVGSLIITPFPEKVLNAGWAKYLTFINSVSDKAKISNFGRHVGLDEMYRFAAHMQKHITDPELAEFERAELMSEGDIRGKYDGFMYHGRLLGYDPKYYASGRVPSWAYPEIPKFNALHDFGEVIINEPHANTGFWDLKPLFPRGNGHSLYETYIARAAQFMERVAGIEHPSNQLLQSICPPIAIFWRAQSDGRPVWALSKEQVIPEALVAQPLQRALEAQPWYGYGTRAQRHKQSIAVLDGPPGISIVDGDDLTGKMADGRIFNGDASSFDASVNVEELSMYAKLVSAACSGSERILRTWNAIIKATMILPGACGVGMLQRTRPHGLMSGCMDTHSAGSVIEEARWNACKPWDSVDSIVKGYESRGGLMSAKKQHITKNSVEIAKLFATRETMFGSIVRGIYGLCMYEDNPSQYMGPDDDDARVIMIVANTWAPVKPHPLWPELCKWVKDHWQIRGEKAKVMQLAAQKLDKRRLFQASNNDVADWEKQAISAAWDACL